MGPDALPPLWACPKCGARFVSANIWHSCGRFRVEDLFAKSEPHVFDLYRRFKRMVERCGPVIEIPQKTRLAGFTVRKSGLRVGLILTRRLPADPRLVKVEAFAPHSIGHYFDISRPDHKDSALSALSAVP